MLGPLVFITTIFFVNFLARIMLSPLMPVVEADLKLDHGQAGVLFLLIALGYVVALMASGYLSSRIKHHRTIVLSAVMLGVTLVASSFSEGLWGLRLGMLLVGATAGLYFPSGMATITSLYPPKHWGRAIGVHELAPNLACVAAPLMVEMLLCWVSWRNTLALAGVASLVLGVAYARFGRGGEFPGEAPALKFLRTLFGQPVFWIMLVLFGLSVGSSMGIFSMLPLFLVSERGMDLYQANLIVAMSRLPTLATALLGGWLADRIGPKKTIPLVMLTTGIMTLLVAVVPSPLLVPVIVLQAMVAVTFFAPAFAVISSLGMATSRNLVISFTVPLAYLLGAGVTPTLIGLCGKEGAFALGIGLYGVLLLLGAGLAAFLKMPRAVRGER